MQVCRITDQYLFTLVEEAPMYINFWYPIATSDEVNKNEPHRAEVLGLKFVAYRDEDGNAHVLADTCTHRGASLGKGWIRDDCLDTPN